MWTSNAARKAEIARVRASGSSFQSPRVERVLPRLFCVVAQRSGNASRVNTCKSLSKVSPRRSQRAGRLHARSESLQRNGFVAQGHAALFVRSRAAEEGVAQGDGHFQIEGHAFVTARFQQLFEGSIEKVIEGLWIRCLKRDVRCNVPSDRVRVAEQRLLTN